MLCAAEELVLRSGGISPGIASCAGTMPAWWYEPIKMARRTLKTAQVPQNRLMRVSECSGRRKQVRKSGTQGMRKRASWCGMIERISVADIAEVRRGLRNVALNCRMVR